MQDTKKIGKLIISILAAVSVILMIVLIFKTVGVFDKKEDTDINDVANYGVVDNSGAMTSDGDIIVADDSTIEMDEIPSNADAYVEGE